MLKGDPMFPMAFYLHTKNFLVHRQEFVSETLETLHGERNEKYTRFLGTEVLSSLYKQVSLGSREYCTGHIMMLWPFR